MSTLGVGPSTDTQRLAPATSTPWRWRQIRATIFTGLAAGILWGISLATAAFAEVWGFSSALINCGIGAAAIVTGACLWQVKEHLRRHERQAHHDHVDTRLDQIAEHLVALTEAVRQLETASGTRHQEALNTMRDVASDAIELAARVDAGPGISVGTNGNTVVPIPRNRTS